MLTGASAYSESYKKEEKLQAWVDKPANTSEGSNSPITDILDLSKQCTIKTVKTDSADETEEVTWEMSEKDKQKMLILEKMLEVITGKKIKFKVLKEIRYSKTDVAVQKDNVVKNTEPQQKLGWGIIYESNEEYHESERMSFSTQGIIKTADGREISLQLELNISREFAYSNNISFRAGDAVKIDPLVINMDVASAKMTETKFAFDLDVDGKTENISFVAPGSGFVALDINNDGTINDGAELFGTRTGDGFADLAAYDIDNNSWIDENDPIYEKLRIWTKNEDGKDVLFALGQKGIGAIFLGSVVTNYSLKDVNNKLNGEIGKTGIYMNENGSVGTIQHVDIVVS